MLFSGPDPIQSAAEAYGAQLRQELQAYPPTENSTDLPRTDDWRWVFAAEAEVLRRLPEAEIRRRAWMIYSRYAEVAGAEKAALRAAANSLNVDTCGIEILRADLLQIQGETTRLYSLGYEIERERGLLTRMITNIAIIALTALVILITYPALVELAKWIIVGTGGLMLLIAVGYFLYRRRVSSAKSSPTNPPTAGVVAAIVACVLIAPILVAQDAAQTASSEPKSGSSTSETNSPRESDSPNMPIGPLVALAGVLGATFSILQRAQRSVVGTDPIVALFGLRAARRQAYLSLVSGAIAALVVFCIFAGGMVQGALFPAFVNKLTHPTTVRFQMKLFDFFEHTGPQTHLDHGKLLVWCFVAGFAERFVPDMLDRFTSAAKK